jgi:hypothetical protein
MSARGFQQSAASMSLPKFDAQGSLFESLESIAADLFDEKYKYKLFATKVWPPLAGHRQELRNVTNRTTGDPASNR